jgi:hypothetical protein
MYAGAALTVVSSVIAFITERVAVGTPASGHLLVSTVGGASVIGTAFPVLLWLWMAWKTQAGRAWSRVLSTIFFNFMSLGVVISIVSAATTTGANAISGASLYFTIAEWGVGLTAIILLWARESGDYFAAARLARAMADYPPPPGYGPPGYPPPPGYAPPGYWQPPQ